MNTQNVIEILDYTGDTKTKWNPENEAEVEAARKTFNELKKKGFAAFRVTGKKGKKGELMREFDPEAGRVIMAPQMVGG